jgi:hypothetical protein
MTSRWINGLDGDASTPPNWFTDENGDHYCLVCRRERAVDIALADAGDLGTEARAKLRSAAVVEFEIERNPDRPEGEIARAARTSIGAVRKARQRLEGSATG